MFFLVMMISINLVYSEEFVCFFFYLVRSGVLVYNLSMKSSCYITISFVFLYFKLT